MNLFKCVLAKDFYYVTANSTDDAAKMLQDVLEKEAYGYSEHRIVLSVEKLCSDIVFGRDLNEKCKLCVVEGYVMVPDIPDDKEVSGAQYTITNNFNDAFAVSSLKRLRNINMIGKNQTFIDKYKFNDDYSGIIFKPIKSF